MSSSTPAFAVGIIGCGRVAVRHALAYALQAQAGVQVAAVADVDAVRAESFAAAHAPDAKPFGDIALMLEVARLDAVSVCVPPRFHRDVTLQALSAGVHVLCEKPPALSTVDAEEMDAAARRADRLLTYGLLHRHIVHAQGLVLLAAQLGTIYSGQARWLRRDGWPPWHGTSLSTVHGTGVVADIGVHVLDLAWYLMGRPAPLSLSARFWRHKTARLAAELADDPYEDHGHSVIDFADARLTLEVAYDADIPEPAIAQVELQGSDGRLIVNLSISDTEADDRWAPVHIADDRGIRTVTTVGTSAPVTAFDAFKYQAAHFVAACRGHEQPVAPAADGVVLQRMLDGIAASAAAHGRQVDLVPGVPFAR